MSNTATIATWAITITGDVGLWSVHVPQQINSLSPGEHLEVALASGVNTFSPPPNANFFLLIPPSGSVVTKTLKGASGDTGVPLNPALPFLYPLPTGSGSLIIVAGSIENVDIYWL